MYRDEQGKLHIETKNVAEATKIQAEQTQKVAEAAQNAAPVVKGDGHGERSAAVRGER
jgi:hypothetical protein